MGTKNSDLVANFEATPVVMTDASLLSGVTRIAQGTIEVAAGDSDNDDIVMLAPIPTHASITSLKIASDTLGGSCTFNVGLYTSAGVVKDEDCFATAVADAGAMADVRFEAADISTCGQKVYTIAGDSTDPGGYYYVAATMAAAGGTLGTMSFIIEYVVN
jgi:porphobilinogen deaminase